MRGVLRYTDTDKDPYTIKKGFWYAHLGWLLWHREAPKSDIRDLQRDPVMRFQDKYYSVLALLQGLVMPTMIAGLFWGDWMGGFLIACTFLLRPQSILSRLGQY
jgi:stearoyl-CoA desaturase (delta-9 desaturase)